MFINPFKTCNFKGIKWKCIELNLGSFFKMAKPSGSKFNSFKKAITSQVGAESEGGSITSKTTHFACNIYLKKIHIYDNFCVIAVYYYKKGMMHLHILWICTYTHGYTCVYFQEMLPLEAFIISL